MDLSSKDIAGSVMSFRGSHAFLSNFATSVITIQGAQFATVEHAFQAWKMTNLEDAMRVKQCSTPTSAKRLARSLPRRDDWEDIKRSVMYHCCAEKFRPGRSVLHDMLQETWPRTLIEGNTWGDMYWGMCMTQGGFRGENWLGKILMLIRKENR